jgi:micrococcal nuclease
MGKLLLFLVLGGYLMAWDVGTVTRVVDGDTIDITYNGKTFRARLVGIETPESFKSKKSKKQAKECKLTEREILHLGKLSKIYTSHALPLGSKVYFLSIGLDWFGRNLVWVKDFNFQIVKDGYAQVYAHADIDYKTKRVLYAIEKRAKFRKKGIWQNIKKDCF